MDEATAPTAGQIRKFIGGVDAELAQLEEQLAPFLQERDSLQERRLLLESLLASFGGSQNGARMAQNASAARPTKASPTPTMNQRRASPRGKVTPKRHRGTVRERVHEEVVEVLREAGRPLHVTDLLEEYVKRGYEAPGQGKPANLTVHLSGWDDIVSPKRGVYALSGMIKDQTIGMKG